MLKSRNQQKRVFLLSKVECFVINMFFVYVKASQITKGYAIFGLIEVSEIISK